MGTCSTCKWWQPDDRGKEGKCDLISYGDAPACACASADDDSNMQTWFSTDRDFGCLLHAVPVVPLDIDRAIDIVLSLARENVLEERQCNGEEDMLRDRLEQLEAITAVEKHLGY